MVSMFTHFIHDVYMIFINFALLVVVYLIVVILVLQLKLNENVLFFIFFISKIKNTVFFS